MEVIQINNAGEKLMTVVQAGRIHDRHDRGHTQIDWLDSYHTFSFGSFQDPTRMGFRALRVINDDRVIPGAGFATHGHRDMEILTYVLEGKLAHQDSLGNGSTIYPGEVQVMSAGTGIQHSEYNADPDNPVHFLQVWILPDRSNLTPQYQQQDFPAEESLSKLRLVASADGRDGSVVIHQDINLYISILGAGDRLTYAVTPDRSIWIQIAKGEAMINGQRVRAGDGIQFDRPDSIELTTDSHAEILLFDLA